MTTDAQYSFDFVLNLQTFEGPLDLLLNMIQQKDIDIFDIPIFTIADEFQKYVEWYQLLDLDKTGEYLAMAAELAYIKSKMLLPRWEDQEEEDPRQDLVQRLIVYQEVQSVANYLKRRDQLGHEVFKRGLDPTVGIPHPPLPPTDIEGPELLDLFERLLKRRLKRQKGHPVEKEKVSVHERIDWLIEQLKVKPKLSFFELLQHMKGIETIVTTFLAILELSRLQRIRLRQIDDKDIEIEAREDFDEVSDQELSQLSDQYESES